MTISLHLLDRNNCDHAATQRSLFAPNQTRLRNQRPGHQELSGTHLAKNGGVIATAATRRVDDSSFAADSMLCPPPRKMADQGMPDTINEGFSWLPVDVRLYASAQQDFLTSSLRN